MNADGRVGGIQVCWEVARYLKSHYYQKIDSADVTILVFNMRMDAQDSLLGFTTDWVNVLAKKSKEMIRPLNPRWKPRGMNIRKNNMATESLYGVV